MSPAQPTRPSRAEKSRRPAKKQLQIIKFRRRTIELETKQDRKGRQLEDARTPDLSRRDRLPTPPPIHQHPEIKNLASFLGCDPVKTNRTINKSAV
jgi:hypothetical protein